MDQVLSISKYLVELGRSFHQHGTDQKKVQRKRFCASLRWHNQTAFTC